jgi:hypothetical protein
MRLGAAARRQQQEQAAAEPLLPTSVPAGGGKKDEEAGWDGEDEVGGWVSGCWWVLRSARSTGCQQSVRQVSP